jgi:hypothetical protein
MAGEHLNPCTPTKRLAPQSEDYCSCQMVGEHLNPCTPTKRLAPQSEDYCSCQMVGEHLNPCTPTKRLAPQSEDYCSWQMAGERLKLDRDGFLPVAFQFVPCTQICIAFSETASAIHVHHTTIWHKCIPFKRLLYNLCSHDPSPFLMEDEVEK